MPYFTRCTVPVRSAVKANRINCTTAARCSSNPLFIRSLLCERRVIVLSPKKRGQAIKAGCTYIRVCRVQYRGATAKGISDARRAECVPSRCTVAAGIRRHRVPTRLCAEFNFELHANDCLLVVGMRASLESPVYWGMLLYAARVWWALSNGNFWEWLLCWHAAFSDDFSIEVSQCRFNRGYTNTYRNRRISSNFEIFFISGLKEIDIFFQCG